MKSHRLSNAVSTVPFLSFCDQQKWRKVQKKTNFIELHVSPILPSYVRKFVSKPFDSRYAKKLSLAARSTTRAITSWWSVASNSSLA